MAASVTDVTATASTGSGSGSLTVNYPATVNAGDLLLMLVSTYHASASNVSTPSGWTALWNGAASSMRGTAFAKVADGSEGGTTFTLSSSGGNFAAAVQIYRIADFHGTIASDITYGTAATGSGSSPNPPSVSASYSNEDTLFLAAAAVWNGSNTPNSGVTITNYTDYQRDGVSGGSNRPWQLSWRRTITGADDDDPAATSTLGGSFTYVTNTIAIRGVTSQNVTLTGVSSAEAEGTPVIQATVSPGGVASAEAAGTPAIQSNIALSGVSSAETHGSTTVSPQPMSITLSSVASAEAVGDPTIIQVQLVQLTAVDTAEAHGSTTVAPQSVNITLTGLSSAEAVGSAAVASQLNLTGISSAEAVGTITLQAYLALTGVASAEAHGTTLIEATISFTGVATAAAFGSLTVNQIQTVTLTGVGSAEAIGSLLLRAVLSLTGIGTDFAAGTLSATRTVSFSGVGSLEAVGVLSITAGAVTITLAGVPSSEAVGLLSALKAVVSGKELPPGLSFQVVIIPGGSGAPVALGPGGSFTQQLPPGGS